MITKNLSTLKIHKLTQAQYDEQLVHGLIDENALYLTPDDESGFVSNHTVGSVEELNTLIHTLAMNQEYDTLKSYNIILTWYANAPLPCGRWCVTIHKPYVDTMVDKPWAGVTATVIASQRIHKLQREMYDGTWLEWEWENPYMELGKEYRTTEKWFGEPIYAYSLELGELPNKGTVQIGIADMYIGKNSTVIDANLVVVNKGSNRHTFAHDIADVSYYVADYSGELAIKIDTTISSSDMSQYTALMTIRYTKKY